MDEQLAYDMLRLAYEVAAQESDDLSTRIGAVIRNRNGVTIGLGANRLPPGLAKTPERLARPLKYEVTGHAEKTAIYDAAYHGLATADSTMYCTWFACGQCADAIIKAGIKHVIGHKQMFDKGVEHPVWAESVKVGLEMLDECGVKTDWLDCEFGDVEILLNGSKWKT